MKTVSVSKLEPTNPIAAYYVKTIKSWDRENRFSIKKNNKVKALYPIYLDDNFLACATIHFNKKASMAKIEMINASLNYYDQIKRDATKELSEIVAEEYGTKDMVFSYIKCK